jgi:hypothetical protein
MFERRENISLHDEVSALLGLVVYFVHILEVSFELLSYVGYCFGIPELKKVLCELLKLSVFGVPVEVTYRKSVGYLGKKV